MSTDDLGLEPATHHTLPMPEWGCALTVAHTSEGAWFSIRQVCLVLGIKSQSQVARLQEHAILRKLVRQMPMPTKERGMRPTWCIHQRGMGFWFGSIPLLNVRPNARERLIEFQEAAVDALSALLRGTLATRPVDERVAAVESRLDNLQAFARHLEGRVGRIEGVAFGPDEGEE
ncbi:MAG: hypothetical protein IVW57_14195 [Ktedonobacterales bacterium]|nr:hypothetical protein [Ktedonobacterales bacterium]